MKKAIRIVFLTILICLVTGLRQGTTAKAYGYFPSNTRKLYISGPVEILVTASDGSLVAKYKEDASARDNEYLLSYGKSDTGEWRVYLPQDAGYHVEITATGDGTIDISFQREDKDYNLYYLAHYHDIDVKKGDVLTMDYEQEFFSRDYSEKIEKPVDPVLKKGKKTISPTAEYKDDIPECTVDVSTNNKLGGSAWNYDSRYPIGMHAVVYAIPYEDCSFTGWYEDGKLVSTENTYTFRIESDRKLVAHFEGETAYGRNGIFRIKIETEGDGDILGDEDTYALDMYPVEITAVPWVGCEFVKWEATGDCIIEDEYSFSTTVKTTTENITLKAVFRTLEDPDILAYKTEGKNIHILVGGYEDAVGYRIYVKAPGSKKYKKLTTIKKSADGYTSYDYEASKAGTYKFKIKAYKKVKKKTVWSKYSEVVKIKIKK
ncbi:MAG: hypothetical protein J5723_00010 [Ruminococcus sp.]|nr:hypothetical protein [Ruminococcus sp.]